MAGAPRATLALSTLDERPTRVAVTLGPTMLSVLERGTAPYRLLRRFNGDTLTHLYCLAPRPSPLPDAPAASLEALLGTQRALLLRHLDRPLTMGAVAGRLHTVPSAATHHVSALAAAGLVARERRGRHILVFRTTRGTDVLGLYEA